MGYRRVPTIYTLTDVEGHEGLVVRMQGVKFGKVRRMLSIGDDVTDQEMNDIQKMFVGALVSWNLEDENGNPIPANSDGVDDQDFDFILAIINSWMGQMTGPDKDLGKGSSSGGTFPGRPLTMEEL